MRSVSRPCRPVVWFGLGCLAAFWLSILVPRGDGSLLGSDGTHYYAYLPSILLDGDLDFTDDYAALLEGEPEKLARALSDLTPKGLPANVWGIGPALLWAPFFLLAHAVVLLLAFAGVPIEPDGYGTIYQAAALTGSIVYGGLGLYLICRAYGSVIEDHESIAWAVLVFAAASNIVYYMTVEPHMSHAVSLFAGGMFVFVWMRGRHDGGLKWAVMLGAIAGVMALVRPQEGLFLVLPYIDRAWLLISQYSRADGGKAKEIWGLLAKICVSGCVAFIVFSPQLLVWQELWGTFLENPYELSGQKFYWLRPRGLLVLFSFHRGLFVWHPIYLLGLAGLILLLRREPSLAMASLLGIGMQWYLISSWWAWDQGKSFGGRMFIGCTPFFVLGVLTLWRWAAERGRERVAVAVAALLVAANVALIVAYVAAWYAA